MSIFENILQKVGLTRTENVRKAYRVARRQAFREYAGAAVNRLTSDWVSSVTSIQQDLRGNIVILRERARDLAKNNPLIRRWLSLCSANIVGPDGFTLQSNIYELVEDPNKKTVKRQQDKIANAKIEAAFREWSRPENCSVNGRMSFRQICRQLIEYKKRDGEAILYKVFNKSRFGFQVHVIAPETLDEKKNEMLTNGNVISMGVELDRWRRPVNYYFRKTDPYLELYSSQAYSVDHVVISAKDIIHFFRQEYENQTRGVTEMSSAMLMLRHLAGYDEATVVAARAGASKGIYFETQTGEAGQFKGDDEDVDGNIVSAAEPGGSEQLPPGVKAVLLDPNYPADQYGDYQKAIQKKLSAGLGVAYASISNDLSEGSYGSNRVGLLDERAQWQMEQQDFIDNVLMALYPDWLKMALLTVINLPTEKFEKFNQPYFVGRTWDWIDPERDVVAKLLELQGALSSPYKIMGERGLDPEEVLEELSNWYKMAEEKGVPIHLGNITVNMSTQEPKDPKKKPSATQDEEDERTIAAIIKPNGVH